MVVVSFSWRLINLIGPWKLVQLHLPVQDLAMDTVVKVGFGLFFFFAVCVIVLMFAYLWRPNSDQLYQHVSRLLHVYRNILSKDTRRQCKNTEGWPQIHWKYLYSVFLPHVWIEHRYPECIFRQNQCASKKRRPRKHVEGGEHKGFSSWNTFSEYLSFLL